MAASSNIMSATEAMSLANYWSVEKALRETPRAVTDETEQAHARQLCAGVFLQADDTRRMEPFVRIDIASYSLVSWLIANNHSLLRINYSNLTGQVALLRDRYYVPESVIDELRVNVLNLARRVSVN